MKQSSPTGLKEKLIKIGAKIVGHDRNNLLQTVGFAVPRYILEEVLCMISELRLSAVASTGTIHSAIVHSMPSSSSGRVRFFSIELLELQKAQLSATALGLSVAYDPGRARRAGRRLAPSASGTPVCETPHSVFGLSFGEP